MHEKHESPDEDLRRHGGFGSPMMTIQGKILSASARRKGRQFERDIVNKLKDELGVECSTFSISTARVSLVTLISIIRDPMQALRLQVRSAGSWWIGMASR